MASPKGERKGKTKHPTIKDPETNQRNKTISSSTNDTEPNQLNTTIYSSTNDPDPNHEFSDNEENSPTVLQTSSKDRKEQILGRASDVFTFKLSIPAVVLTIAVAMYIQHVEYYYEQKFADLMKYEVHMKQLKTLSVKVPSLEHSLSELKARLIPIDTSVVDIESKIKTANKNLTNYETRIASISETNSKLEGDLPKQQERFNEIENKLSNMNITISYISKNITSIGDQSNDVTEKIAMAEKNQTSLTGLLNETVERAEDVYTNVSKVQKMFTKVLIHLPTIEKINKSVTVIMKIDHHLPQLQRRLNQNKFRVHGLELELNETESKFNDIKNKSESAIITVSLAMEKQTDIENKIKLSNTHLEKLTENMLKTDENIENRLVKLKGDFEISENIFLDRTSKLDRDISTTEGRTEIMVEKVDLYNGKLENFRSDVDSLSKDVNKMKSFEDYTGPKVRELDIQVRNLQSQNTGLFQPINVCVALAFILIAALFYMTYYRYDNGGTQFREHERTESHSTPPFMSQRAPSILDRIQRVPVFDNKVCVLSFYSETMNLHKQLVKSALATNKRGGNIEIIQHMVRRHEDILNIPGARYIFVFVDFNERNVILENPGQDLGDKKLVTVQAAQKLGADVFVTYVRDRGSNQLVPGNLYNQELSAFTSHQVLRGLESNQRCFSVYETFNNTQKESIVRSIS